MHKERSLNRLTFKELAEGQLFVARYEIEDFIKQKSSKNTYIACCVKTGPNSYTQNNKLVLVNTTGKIKRNYEGYIHKNAHVLKVSYETKVLKDTREGVEFRISG